MKGKELIAYLFGGLLVIIGTMVCSRLMYDSTDHISYLPGLVIYSTIVIIGELHNKKER